MPKGKNQHVVKHEDGWAVPDYVVAKCDKIVAEVSP